VDLATLLGGETTDLLSRRAAATPDRTAVIDAETGARTTYARFDTMVDGLASALTERAPAVGRVGLLIENRWAFALSYFAVARLGGAVVPLNSRLPADRLGDQLSRASVDLLVCDRDCEPRARAVPAPRLQVLPVACSHPADVRGLLADGESVDQTGSSGVEPTVAPPDTEQVVLFTSGTTGEPKGVRLTRRNLVASAAGSAARLGVHAGDSWLVSLPMYHMGGLAPLVRSTLFGTTTVLGSTFEAASTARECEAFDITGISLVPTMLSRLLDAGWNPAGPLRFVLLGGAPASRDLVRRAVDRGVPVCPTYGTTETASQVATATPSEAADVPGSVGRPLAVTDVSVLAPDGQPVDTGDRGEVVVDGPTVTPGYLDAGQTDAAFGPAGFHTGDIGYRDEAGRLWVTGRLDDRIVTGGENVDPDRVADVLGAHEGIDAAAVVGIPDDEWGERVGALVVPVPAGTDGDGDGVTREELEKYAGARLADFAVPKTVGFAESLPRTASGTVDREAVRERLSEIGGEGAW
jgi:O-succinylbenzoic acid--CoA ligase